MAGPLSVWLVVGGGAAGMHGGGGEAGDAGERVGFGVVGEVVGLGDGQVVGHGDVDFGAQGVSDPADAEFLDVVDASGAGDGRGCLIDAVGVDGVHEAGADLSGRGA